MSKRGAKAAPKRAKDDISDNGEDSQEVPPKKTKAKEEEEEGDEIEDDVEDIDEDEEGEDEEELGEEEEDDEEDEEDDVGDNDHPRKPFTQKSFVILKTDFDEKKADAPIWKIDGCSLLQKYIPDKDAGDYLYKSTSVYSGWQVKNKDKYYAAPVEIKKTDKGDVRVELKTSQLKELNSGAD